MNKDSFIAKIHRLPFHWYHIFIFPLLTAFILTNYVVTYPAGWLYTNVFEPLFNGPDGPFWSLFAIYFTFIAHWLVFPLWFLIFPQNRPILGSLGKGLKGNTLKMFGLGLLIGGGMNLLCALGAMINGDIHISFSPSPVLQILAFFPAVLIQSGAEEMVCRGYIYQKLRRSYRSPLVAMAGSALWFMILHLFNPGVSPMALLYMILTAVKYTLIIYYFDSFWCAVGIHTAWNYMQNIILGLPNSGLVSLVSVFKLDASNVRSSMFYQAEFGLEGTVFSCIVTIAVAAAVIYIGRKKKLTSTDIWEEQIKEELNESRTETAQ